MAQHELLQRHRDVQGCIPLLRRRVNLPTILKIVRVFPHDRRDLFQFLIRLSPVAEAKPAASWVIKSQKTRCRSISLETSTNLVSWWATTNGVYGSPTVAQFFRMRMTNLTP